jgi:hypothetical protein
MVGLKEGLVICLSVLALYLTFLCIQLYGVSFQNWDIYIAFYVFMIFNMYLLQKRE